MAAKSYNVGYGPNPTQVQYIASKDILTTAPAISVLDIACEKKTMQRQMGASIVYRRWFTGAVDATPAPEGAVKESRTLTWEDYNVTMLRYTERYQVTRVDYDLSPFNAVKGATERLKQLIISTRERVRWNAAVAGTNVLYNSAAVTARNQVNGPLTPGRFQTIGRSLENLKAMPFQPAIQGANKEGTSPVEEAFYVFTHTDNQPDLRGFPGFTMAVQYPNGSKAHKREFGAWQQFRYFTTPEAIKYSAGGAASTTMLNTGGVTDVYPTIVCGKEALCSVKLEGDGKEGFGNMGVDILDKPDKADPNNSWVDIVASWYDAALITANDWIWRLESGATANL
jgi:N4-gp56 family major capsid protein